MTVDKFAKITGYNKGYIQKSCREGRIPAEFSCGKYDISPALVPSWKAKRNKKLENRGQSIHNNLRMYQDALDEYNRIHGTKYSYGEAVSRGLIT